MASCPDSKYIQGKDSEESTVILNVAPPKVILLSCNKQYLRSLGCILHLVQVVASIAGIICIACGSTSYVDVLHFPLNWHLRAYIFASVLALLITVALLVLNISSLIDIFPLNWPLCELIVYGTLSLLYICCSSMVASAASYIKSPKQYNPHQVARTWHALIFATVIGYACFVLHALSAIVAFRNLRKPQSQFAAHKLPPERMHSTTSQTSDSQSTSTRT